MSQKPKRGKHVVDLPTKHKVLKIRGRAVPPASKLHSSSSSLGAYEDDLERDARSFMQQHRARDQNEMMAAMDIDDIEAKQPIAASAEKKTVKTPSHVAAVIPDFKACSAVLDRCLYKQPFTLSSRLLNEFGNRAG